MVHATLFDIPPQPAGIGALLAILSLVIGFILLLTAGLVVYLWFRKRSLRGIEMVRHDTLPASGWSQGTSPTVREGVSASPAQPNSPNQP